MAAGKTGDYNTSSYTHPVSSVIVVQDRMDLIELYEQLTALRYLGRKAQRK